MHEANAEARASDGADGAGRVGRAVVDMEEGAKVAAQRAAAGPSETREERAEAAMAPSGLG